MGKSELSLQKRENPYAGMIWDRVPTVKMEWVESRGGQEGMRIRDPSAGSLPRLFLYHFPSLNSFSRIRLFLSLDPITILMIPTFGAR